MAFGDHLRSQEDVVFMTAEGFDDAVAAVLAAGRILVEADDARRRQEFVKLLFHFFCAAAKEFYVFAATRRANRRHGLFGITVMAAQVVSLAMVDHGHVARITFDDIAALAAHDECREAAAVQEDDGLLPGCQCLFQEV